MSSPIWIPKRSGVASGAVCCLLVAFTVGCGAFTRTEPEPVPWDDPWETALNGSIEEAQARAPVDSPVPPQQVVARAVEGALASAIGVPEDVDETGFALTGGIENLDTSAHTEAWLRVDEAHVLAALQAEPLPEPDPVSVETQRLAAAGRVPPGELHLHVPGLGERRSIRLFDNTGRMRPAAVREVSALLRDRRDERVRTIEPRVLTILYLVGQYYDSEVEVVSGYRIGGENASRGSRHGSGRACDFRIDGVGTRTLSRHVDARYEEVGVGYYPTSRFVHVDHRESAYYWIDRSGPGQRSRTRSRTPRETPDAGSDITLRSVHVTERELFVPPPVPEEE